MAEAAALQQAKDDTICALLAAMRECGETSEKRAVFLDARGAPVPEIREMGEKLNRLGGLPAMLEVTMALEAYVVQETDAPWMRSDLRELDFCWNGVGEWMC